MIVDGYSFTVAINLLLIFLLITDIGFDIYFARSSERCFWFRAHDAKNELIALLVPLMKAKQNLTCTSIKLPQSFPYLYL